MLKRLQKGIEERLKKKPYQNVVKKLRTIADVVAPMDKNRLLVNVSNDIVETIMDFWKGLKIPKEKLTIDGDSLLMIYIYLTIRSKVTDLFAQVKLMNEFATHLSEPLSSVTVLPIWE